MGDEEVQSSTLDHGVLMSPEEFFSKRPAAQREFMSTPNECYWPRLGARHDGSGGSAKADSGYCSLTPQSADSLIRVFDKECQICSSAEQCTKSTPVCTCGNLNEKLSPQFDYVDNDPKPVLTLKDVFDEPMESSLYESEVQQRTSEERQSCNFEFMEIGEEKSVDFVDSGICLKDTTKEFDSGKSENSLAKNDEDSNVSEEFFSPIACLTNDSSNSFAMVSNEITPTENKPTVIEKFRSAAKKVCTLVYFRSFSISGVETVDIMYQLGVKKNCPDVIGKILSFLPDKDLVSVSVVCKLWNKLLKNDRVAYKRLKAYKSAMKMKMENYYSPQKSNGSGAWRQTLVNITNQNSPTQDISPRHSPPVSPQSMRFHYYQKAAKNLKDGERLLRCPKCRYPSHDKGSPNVHCSRKGCQHRFCVWCLCETENGTPHDCPPLYTPLRRTTPKVPRIGSKVCKRNLKRL